MHRNEELSTAIIKSAQHIVLVLDADGRIALFNPYLEELTGWLESEVKGRDWFETFIPKTDRARIRKLFGRTLMHGRTRVNLNPIVTKDGRELLIEWKAKQLTSSDGQVIGLLSTGENVTVRTQLEKELRESHEQLLIESSSLSRLNEATNRLWQLYDLHDGLDEILSATIEMLGADFGDIQLFDPARNVLQIAAHQGCRQIFLDRFREVSATDNTACGRAMRSGEVTIIEDVETDPLFSQYSAVAKECGFRAMQCAPLNDSDGTLLGMISTYWGAPHRFYDSELGRLSVYARQAAGYMAWCRARQALEGREEQMRAVLNSAVDAILTIDEHGIIRDANPATEHMFCRSREDLIGENVKVLMPHPYRNKHDRNINRYMLARVAHAKSLNREVVGCRKDGTVFPIEISISKINSNHLFTAIVRDISERRQLEKHLLNLTESEQLRIGQELHDGAQQSLVAVEFVAKSIAKEIEALGKLSESNFTSEHADCSSRLERLHRLMNTLQKGLTRTSQEVHTIARNLFPVHLDVLGLTPALKGLADRVSQNCNIQCTVKSGGKVSLSDRSKALHLFRIAQESVNNAVKHSQCSEIEINVSTKNGQLNLEILDNGIGFDFDSIERKGMGMRTMTYRANLIGATLNIRRRNEGGTCIYCGLMTFQTQDIR